ncbi:hypothetical protein TNIN_263971 [Trichonephila inaurata madagascariensis]|uniref:Uncharacterized protein n=1 Tax=Trichonephila inaurata madagascariensis TaxID=2747483 RepID=A0A8X6MLX3_9ARAC|nr:hypothetical protein TNIN_263971 [Trichonephila inaurata madagascariensis]
MNFDGQPLGQEAEQSQMKVTRWKTNIGILHIMVRSQKVTEQDYPRVTTHEESYYDFAAASGTIVSRQTVYKRPTESYAQKPPLTQFHKIALYLGAVKTTV